MAGSSDPPDAERRLFDARLFEPPSWATSRQKSPPTSHPHPQSTNICGDDHDEPGHESDHSKPPVEEDDEGELKFTLGELKKLLRQAIALKENGNAHFMAKPRRLDEAKQSYLEALDHLPTVAPRVQPAPHTGSSAIEEITDAEAESIVAEGSSQLDDERGTVEADIRQWEKAFVKAADLQEEWKNAADACTQALKIDKYYTKALHRRGIANEKIGSWSSLSAAQEDYRQLSKILPPTSPQRAEVMRALASLPQRISVQQDQEKDEMMGKLKDLGNSILGKFGLSTDMFQFDEQPGGGYNLRFQS